MALDCFLNRFRLLKIILYFNYKVQKFSMIPKAVINCTLYSNNIDIIFIYNNNNNYKKNIFKFILKSLLTKNIKYRVQ